MVAKMEPRQKQHPIKKDSERGFEFSSQMKRGLQEFKDQAAEKVEQVKRMITDEAEQYLDGRRERAAKRVEKIGSAVHRAAHLLRAGKIDSVADSVDAVADATDRASEYLSDVQLDEMREDLAEAVRRHPAATFGGLFVAGVLAARFLRAGLSQDQQDDEDSDEDTES